MNVFYESNPPHGSAVHSNPMMCINDTVRERLGGFIQRLETTHQYCPTCKNEDYTLDCKTFVGDLNVFRKRKNGTTVTRSLVQLKEVVGRVTIRVHNDEIAIKNESKTGKFDCADINQKERFIINCPACEEPGLFISGTMIPPIEFFEFLDMSLGNTRVAIQFEKYGSYRMLRGLYAALTDRFKREVVVDHEEDGDCHFLDVGDPYDYEDLMACERITGDLFFNATDVRNLHRAQWKKLKMLGAELRLTGGSELIKLLNHEVSVDFVENDFNFRKFSGVPKN